MTGTYIITVSQLTGERQQNVAYTLDELVVEHASFDYFVHIIKSLDRSLLETFGQVLPDRRWTCRYVEPVDPGIYYPVECDYHCDDPDCEYL